ncbi:MAG: baseplate J/gp47 family protein [Lachnospiraceae bacterium]|nr:baseplate J/gp47 family protein [Lachnospiraceae bacterium]
MASGDGTGIEFVNTDTEALVNKLVAGYEEFMGRKLYPADPVRAFILWLASIIIQERVYINESAKQNIPRYATGENLDIISGIFHNVSRLEAVPASVTLQFSISKAPVTDYIITDTLEVTADGYVNFATTENIVFAAGETTAVVEAECTLAGETGNGFLPGEINALVSGEFLYFEKVENITVSEGGSEKEDDASFYSRMRESEESYTTAGAKNSYSYHARSVSALVSDVSVESPEPGKVDVKIMLQDGVLPDEEMISKVQEYLNADDIRPLTDYVVVSAPGTVTFDIDVVYYISSMQEISAEKIKDAVEAYTRSYVAWQTSKMGRDINPSYFNALIMQSGIKRVEIISPVFTHIGKGSVAVLGDLSITFGGMEDD